MDTTVEIEAAPRLSPWRALASENYRLFLCAHFVSQSGRFLQQVGQSWLVLDLTGSALALGTITVVQYAPIILLSLFAGALADRFSKRRLLMVLQGATLVFALALALLVLTGYVRLWQVYVFALLWGTVNAFEQPTRQAFLSELVDRDQIQSGVGLNSSVQNVSRIIGPAIGGVIIAAWGTGWCFAINAACYGVASAALAAIQRDRLKPAATALVGRLRTQVADGLRYVAGDRELFVPLALLGVIGTIGYNWSVALPLLARYTFLSGATGFGALSAAQGAGSLVGALLVASRPPARAVGLSGVAAAFSVALLGLAVAPAFALAMLALAVAGALGVVFTAGVQTRVQLRSRPELRGRVLGLLFLLSAGGTPLGGVLTGSVAAASDIRVALALNAVVCLVSCTAAILYFRRHAVLEFAPAGARDGA